MILDADLATLALDDVTDAAILDALNGRDLRDLAALLALSDEGDPYLPHDE